MNILITGANGMLGSCLSTVLGDLGSLYLTSSSETSLVSSSQNYFQKDLLDADYHDLINWSTPDIIIHCAAITDLSYCEKNPNVAFSVNSDSLAKLLVLCPNSQIIFISSDAIYGDHCLSSIHSSPSPTTIYGLTKLKAEEFLTSSNNDNYAVVRTTIVGPHMYRECTSFVGWLLKSLRNSQSISLYSDNYFSPISIWDLASEIRFILLNKIKGIWNISGSESCSKFEFGSKLATQLGYDLALISEGFLGDHTATVPRCLDQTLSCAEYINEIGRSLPGTDATIMSISDHLNFSNAYHGN